MQWQHQGYTIRPACAQDANDYFVALFDPLEEEVARFTGSASVYPKEVVIPFFLRCVADETRHDFLILSPEGRIVGESVINEYDPQTNTANYRIAISGAQHRGRGIGTWALRCACAFAFETLRLDALTLEVFEWNTRAVRVYQKCGFTLQGREEDALLLSLTRAQWETAQEHT